MIGEARTECKIEDFLWKITKLKTKFVTQNSSLLFLRYGFFRKSARTGVANRREDVYVVISVWPVDVFLCLVLGIFHHTSNYFFVFFVLRSQTTRGRDEVG